MCDMHSGCRYVCHAYSVNFSARPPARQPAHPHARPSSHPPPATRRPSVPPVIPFIPPRSADGGPLARPPTGTRPPVRPPVRPPYRDCVLNRCVCATGYNNSDSNVANRVYWTSDPLNCYNQTEAATLSYAIENWWRSTSVELSYDDVYRAILDCTRVLKAAVGSRSYTVSNEHATRSTLLQTVV